MGCALYNPRPADGDIVLPLPCDGGIVFRKVIVPVGGPLADLPIQVGQEGGAYSFVEKSRPAFIAGGFTESSSDKKSKSSYYLMAKYELTISQYQALNTLNGGAAQCPNPEASDGRFPVTNVNWFDALRTAHQYNVGCASMQRSAAQGGSDFRLCAAAHRGRVGV